MNKIANVLYAYVPSNVDELELKVGDKIDVIGFEEEGWLKGRLKGKTGVFPSNFVQVVDSGPPNHQINSLTSVAANNSVAQSQVTNKLNSFVNKLTKPNMSTHTSLASNNGSINSPGNNARHLDSLVDQSNQQEGELSAIEKRAKPIRGGMGYGDIFSGGKPKLIPVNTSANSSMEKMNTSFSCLQFHKPIPKKPPPPAPTEVKTDQAPPPPPKPINNQFNPLLNQSKINKPREQARVIYPYEAVNEDELTLQVGDVIDILSKKVEDQGWWRGELRGKIGVFPDNFVEFIKPPVPRPQEVEHSGSNSPHVFLKSVPSTHMSYINSSTTSNTPEQQDKLKPFNNQSAKGLSKELESNMEKTNNSQASFLSLKRNKLQQLPTLPSKPKPDEDKVFDDGASVDSRRSDLSLTNGNKSSISGNSFQANNSNGLIDTSPGKLNHITANRAKGPTRRPPSHILSKRTQSEQSKSDSDNSTHLEQDGNKKETNTPAPSSNIMSTPKAPVLSDHQQASIKASMSMENVINEHNAAAKNPRAFQRTTPANTDATSTNRSPQWMLDLKKAHAERKRESSSSNPRLNEAIASEFATEQIVNKDLQEEQLAMSLAQVSCHNVSNGSNKADAEKSSQSEEILELKQELLKLRSQIGEIASLKSDVEDMKRYMKDLVGILADERRRIAAFQINLESNFK